MRDRFLQALAQLALTRTNLVLGVALVLTALSGTLAATSLGLDSNQDHLVSPELDHQRRFLDFLETFGDRELLYVVVEAQPDTARARAVVAEVASSLRTRPELFSQVTTGLDPADVGERALLLAPAAELTQLSKHAGDLRALGELDGYERLLKLWTRRLSAPDEQPTSAEEAEAGFHFLEQVLSELARPGSHSPDELLAPVFPEFTLSPRDTELRLGELLLLTAVPRRNYGELNPVEAPLAELRAALARALARHPGVEGGVTGRPAISADEVRRTSEDTARSAIFALLGVALVFGLFFRSALRPLLAIVALLVGIALTAGFATLAVGTLNFLSSVFLIILIGLGIDYGVHLLARYQDLRAAGNSQAEAIREGVLQAGRGNVTAALSSALAFYSMLLTDFRGLSELGLIAGSGILLCCLSTMLVLPALLVRFESAELVGRPLPRMVWLDRLHARPRRLLLVGLVLSLVGAPALSHVAFEENLLSLQSEREDSVRWERRMLEAEASTWITASRVTTLEQAVERRAAFAALDSSVVARVEGPSDYVGLGARTAALAALDDQLGSGAAHVATPHVERVEAALAELSDALGGAAEGALRQGGEAAAFVERLLALADRADELSANLGAAGLEASQQALFAELARRFARLQALTRATPWTLETLPLALREHFVGEDGSLAVYVYPAEDVWDPEHMTRFLAATRAIDPQLTGSTVSVHEAGRVLREAFLISTAVTLLVVGVILLVDFRGRTALLAALPLALGAVWLAEVMGALGVSLNMANFFSVPILLGLGIDDGVHIAHHARDLPGAPLGAAGTGVILSSLTTAIGFGSLMTSSHPGLASLGAVMALGAGVLLIAAVLVVPALVRLRQGSAQ